MTEFVIIKNMELPEGHHGNGKYPFAMLGVGDGFEAPNDMGSYESGEPARANTVRCCAVSWAKRHNPSAKFTVHNDRARGVVMCKRIA